jgi:hypothetical protein
MSGGGVAVVRYLLAHYAPLVALVPSDQIVAGELLMKALLPGISVKEISSVIVSGIRQNETPRTYRDRVQTAAVVKTPEGTPSGDGYPGLKAIMSKILDACPSQRAVIAGISVQNIEPDIEGPDLDDEASSLVSQTRDFMVTYTA